mmetsp:Transcript_8264/g.14388  ORF Transcript_8264/g.14388 Transcript_8264/m.14388 type:complete len:237 (+) Transcript_8264:187-897(+)
MTRRGPLKRLRWICLILLRRRLHSTQIFLLSRRRICEHDDAIRLFLWSNRTVALAQIKGTCICLSCCNAGGVRDSEGGRFGLSLFLGFGLLCRLVGIISAIDIHAVLLFILTFLFFLFLVHIHSSTLATFACLGLLLCTLPRQPCLVLRCGRKRDSLHALLLFFLLLFQLLWIRKRTWLSIALNLKFLGIFEILIQTNGDSRSNSKAQHMHERVPMPVLEPQDQAHSTCHFRKTIT